MRVPWRKINCRHFKDKTYIACKSGESCHGDMCSLKSKYDGNKPVKGARS